MAMAQFLHEPLEDTMTCIRTFRIQSLVQGNKPLSLTLTNHRLADSSELEAIKHIIFVPIYGSFRMQQIYSPEGIEYVAICRPEEYEGEKPPR
jgi:hypothetical protein